MDRRQFLSQVLSAQKSHSASSPLKLSLAPWQPTAEDPWDTSAVKHLHHRLGVAGSREWIEYALAVGPQEYIDFLTDDALIGPLMPDPPEGWEKWLFVPPYNGPDPKGYLVEDDIYHMAKMDIRNQWASLMSIQKYALREKLTLFWSNHFVIQEQKVYHTQQVYRFLRYLREHVWGNFKQMVKDVTIQPAMLVYLDGVWSEKDKLNENYARELMELFTMGITDRYGNPNYTQEDVRELALALTGWRFRYEAPPPNVLQEYFAWYYFDFEKKTAPWGVEKKLYGLLAAKQLGTFPTLDEQIEADVIDVMFEVRGEQIAWHICKKIYQFFVHRDASGEVQQSVIEELAARFRQDWELKPVIEMLIRSEHFFDRALHGAIVKSPHDMMVGAMVQLRAPLTQSAGGTMAWQGVEMNQWLLDPVNVKGWQGHRTWLTSATLEKRITFLRKFITGPGVESHYIDAHTGAGYEWIYWREEHAVAWAAQFPGWRKDAQQFINEVAETIFAIAPGDEQLEDILSRTINFPRYEWPQLSDPERLILTRKLVFALLLLPEYQLS